MAAAHKKNMKYRPDIDGLRALAILPVVFFHAGASWLKGGFVGVDVFFVVSGYLITSLIVHEFAAGGFSIASFYERRVRRIFPALFTVVLCSSIAAALILSPTEFEAYGRSAVASALFGSNILFWSESGYFDAPAEIKPLLHTWSLAVEEQFYIVFPLFLLAVRRLFRARYAVALAPVVAVSFLASAWYVWSAPYSVFYLAQFRAWELLLGSLLAVGAIPPAQSRLAREIGSATGVALIVFSSIAYSKDSVFPGAAAALPCLGALLVVHAGSSGDVTLMGRLFSTRPVVFVGLISYPLYLWHWPLLVFARHLVWRELTAAETGAVLMLSLVLAGLTWRFIERPLRRRGNSSATRRRVFAGAAASVLASATFGLLATALPNAIARQADYVGQHVRGKEDYRERSCFMDLDQSYGQWSRHGSCLTDNGAPRTVLIWGDSYAAHYLPGLATNPAAAAFNFVQYSAASCPPVLEARVPWAPKCQDFNSHLEDVLARYRIDTAVLAARWERYWGTSVRPSLLAETIAYLRARGIAVVLVGQGPSFGFSDPGEYVFRTGQQRSPSKPGRQINSDLRAIFGYSAFFDPNEFLCPDGTCMVIRGRRLLYLDSGHYSTYGSELISASLLSAIEAGSRSVR
jgi:peptidoglycan/LPS O-acetylase OafA/YrhL